MRCTLNSETIWNMVCSGCVYIEMGIMTLENGEHVCICHFPWCKHNLSPFCPTCLDANDLENIAQRSHISCISPLSRFKIRLIGPGSFGEEQGELEGFPSSCSGEEQGGMLLTLRLAGDTGSFEVRRQTNLYSSLCEQLSFFPFTLQHCTEYIYCALKSVR